MTPEKIVQNKILEYLSDLQSSGKKVYFERRQAGGYNYKHGIPDVYAIINGIHLEIEVKKKNGTRRPTQIDFAMKCKKYGVAYICCDDVEKLKELVEKILKIKFTFIK